MRHDVLLLTSSCGYLFTSSFHLSPMRACFAHANARLDRQANVLWRAPLPGDAGHDCFVSLQRRDGAIVARTYSSREVVVDVTGQPLELARAA